jgi:hypothetical protein
MAKALTELGVPVTLVLDAGVAYMLERWVVLACVPEVHRFLGRGQRKPWASGAGGGAQQCGFKYGSVRLVSGALNDCQQPRPILEATPLPPATPSVVPCARPSRTTVQTHALPLNAILV